MVNVPLVKYRILSYRKMNYFKRGVWVGEAHTSCCESEIMDNRNEENKNERTKKAGASVWWALAAMMIAASTSGCLAWVRWGIV